jgi:hypothetical protein
MTGYIPIVTVYISACGIPPASNQVHRFRPGFNLHQIPAPATRAYLPYAVRTSRIRPYAPLNLAYSSRASASQALAFPLKDQHSLSAAIFWKTEKKRSQVRAGSIRLGGKKTTA